MLYDIQTIVWKEWRELFAQRGRTRSGFLTLFLVIGVFSIVVPLQAGRDLLTSPLILFLSAWTPFLLVATVIADSFAGERERHTLETLLASRLSDRAILLGKIAAGVSYGWGMMLIVLLIQVVTMNVAFGEGQFLFYQGIVGPASVGVSLLAACLAANVGVLVSLRAPSARQAQQTLSIATMALFVVPIVGFRFIPETWRVELTNRLATGGINVVVIGIMLFLLVLNVLFFGITLARFRRTQLILSM